MGDEQTLDFLANLPSTTGYTPNDRFHDFRRVLNGSAEGKRVLAEILSWGHVLKPFVFGSPIDANLTHVRAGEHNIALRLLATVNNEPKPKPQQATTKRTT